VLGGLGLVVVALACAICGVVWSNLGGRPAPAQEAPASTPTPVEAMPTFTPMPLPTQAPTVEPTATASPVVREDDEVEPAPGSMGAPCDCSGDVYNCDSFSTREEMTACFEYCMSIGAGDVHKLDQDGDGAFCESSW